MFVCVYLCSLPTQSGPVVAVGVRVCHDRGVRVAGHCLHRCGGQLLHPMPATHLSVPQHRREDKVQGVGAGQSYKGQTYKDMVGCLLFVVVYFNSHIHPNSLIQVWTPVFSSELFSL